VEKHRSVVCELVSPISFHLNSCLVGELEAVMGQDGGAPLFPGVGPFTSVSDKQSWKNTSCCGELFFMVKGETRLFQGAEPHVFSGVVLQACGAITSGLAWPLLVRAHTCRRLLLAS